ncbi:MAG TPA: ABC transporter ATP-binding protein, partial [Thermoanaerobaculia bacterium]|nr:ABC transporter ATP-binding protein [Thermoanaerobaculia bacterium]
RIAADDPRGFREAGGAFVPGDRRHEGLVLDLSLAENLALSGRRSFFLNERRLREEATEGIRRYGVRTEGPDAKARPLSGGNQQKLVLARELSARPRLVVAVHPTRGLDLASSAEVRARLVALSRDGAAILVVTADPDEAFELKAPVRVMYRGDLSPSFPAGTPLEILGRRMAGLST